LVQAPVRELLMPELLPGRLRVARTMDTKHPRAQESRPVRPRLSLLWDRSSRIDLLPLMWPIIGDIACLGGIAISICTESSMAKAL
jgi:hypothetical protein